MQRRRPRKNGDEEDEEDEQPDQGPSSETKWRCTEEGCGVLVGIKNGNPKCQAVSRHYMAVHAEIEYPCAGCEETYSRTDALKRHLGNSPDCEAAFESFKDEIDRKEGTAKNRRPSLSLSLEELCQKWYKAKTGKDHKSLNKEKLFEDFLGLK